MPRRASMSVLRWAFTALAAATLIGYIASHRWLVGRSRATANGGSIDVFVVKGAVWVSRADYNASPRPGFSCYAAPNWSFTFEAPAGNSMPVPWHFGILSISSFFAISLGYPMVVFTAAAAPLWWAVRRLRACQRAGRCLV